MAQILDLSKRFTQDQIEAAGRSANTSRDLPAGGYVCEIVSATLNDDQATGKANIELHVDVCEGEYSGYFQSLEDRYGFWGLRGWMSFKESQLPSFQRTCAAICNSNPGFVFNPLAGATDIDTLKGKKIGVVVGKEEYESNGDVREKNTVARFVEVEKIKTNSFGKIPALKKLNRKPVDTSSFMAVDETVAVPFA